MDVIFIEQLCELIVSFNFEVNYYSKAVKQKAPTFREYLKSSTDYDNNFKEKVEKLILNAEALNHGQSIYENPNTLLGAFVSAYHEDFLEEAIFNK